MSTEESSAPSSTGALNSAVSVAPGVLAVWLGRDVAVRG
jgi:hypothetical protein